MITIKLTEKQTRDIESVYGLWDFCFYNLQQNIYCVVFE
jgi:hypothetical protein